jgi:hypothetical protein
MKDKLTKKKPKDRRTTPVDEQDCPNCTAEAGHPCEFWCSDPSAPRKSIDWNSVRHSPGSYL